MEENTKESVTEEQESNFESLAKKSKKEIQNYEEGIKHGKRIFFPLLLIIAVSSDAADPIPVAGFVIKIFALLIIWYNFGILGKAPNYLENKHKIEISWRTKTALRFIGFMDMIPLLNLLPLTTLSIAIVWFRQSKAIAKMENKKRSIKSRSFS